MEIQNIELSKLTPYGKNAKKHPKKQIEQVAASIKEFGFRQPIVTDKDMVLIVGHGRLEAAKLLGLKEVPVVIADLTEEQAKAYRLADNKLNETEWDMDLVLEELTLMSDDMVELTGFSEGVDLDELGDSFDLPSGDKSPYRQMTFTLADNQASLIENAVKVAKGTEQFNYIETFGNENGNGNALYLILTQWVEQNT